MFVPSNSPIINHKIQIMETKEKKQTITVTTTVNAPADKVWHMWTDPQQVTRWNNASDDWHTPYAENDLRTGGKFMSRMAARDGSAEFDFGGTYDRVETNKLIEYTMSDGRRVKVTFESSGDSTTVTETFDPEDTNSIEMQRSGWQAIMDNFKKYAENPATEKKLQFETVIDAPQEKVYNTMIAPATYNEWTREFNASSHFEGSWEKGSRILFIGEENGKKGGMVSRIKDNIPNKFISIEHLGILDGDKEVMDGEEVRKWSGALENYTFVKAGNKTKVVVEMDSNEEMKSYFEKTWPKALKKLKEICEK
jgi:uncharacterized protein YndB with AHSA1/START domain